MTFFHTHAHSQFSTLDALSTVPEMVAKAARYEQPALGLTDHGLMSGVFQLYTECRKHDILPFPGLEAYVVEDHALKDANRYHLTMLALDNPGYKLLVRLCSLSHQRDHYHFKPRISVLDLVRETNADPTGASGIAILTGCYFGSLMQHYGDTNEGVREVQRLKSMFPHTFVELQNHDTPSADGRPSDTESVSWLVDVAASSSTPTILTQDCHYLNRADCVLHDRMKMIAYGSNDPGDVGFPGDSYHLSTGSWVRSHVDEDIWSQCADSYSDLLNLHNLRIPTLDNYSFHIPSVGLASPHDQLVSECRAELKAKGLDKPRYITRLEYELGVVEQTGFASYFHLVADYCRWAREEGIFINARGSANGYLVCYLMGITDLDPVRWKLSADRFLTVDRERPPDIDLDVEDTRRQEIVAYLEQNYDLTQIGTFHRLGMNEDGTGSMFVSWIASRRRSMSPDQFKKEYGGVKTLLDMKHTHPDVLRELDELARLKTLKASSAHAAGYVMSAPTLKLDELVPTMLIPSSNASVTQMTMDDIENAGFVKIDLLGLRSLTTLRMASELVAESIGGTAQEVLSTIEGDLSNSKVFSMLRKGVKMNGIFQMEGGAAAQGCRQIGVRSLEDMVLVNALYRPAARDAGYTDTYLRRRGKLERVPSFHPVFDKHLAPTLGIPAFQEQVLDIMRDLNIPATEVNLVLKAIKGKHGGTDSSHYFDRAYEQFVRSCADAGLNDDQIDHAWDLVEGFSRYGFNRAHAVAYSLLGYKLAWIKVHYPLEFHTALLATTAGSLKENDYVREVRRVGIRILPPDVNRSGALWTIDRHRKAIRKGMLSIKGVGEAAADEVWASAPYSSIEDLIKRTHSRTVTGGKDWASNGVLKGVLKKLCDAGALHSLGIEPGEGDE